MRYLIFTDIHGNLEAFHAVLKAVQKKKIDHYIFLGDLVGYGASPNEVIQKILTLKPLSIIRGNHDKAVSGPRFGPDLQSHRRVGHLLDQEDDRPEAPRFPGPAEAEPRGRPGFHHHLPRRALRRGLLHLRRVRRGRGLLLHPDAGLLLRPHPLPLRLHREGRQRRGHLPRGELQRGQARKGRPLSHQSRLGRPAAGPQSPGRLRHLRLRGADRSSSAASNTTSKRPSGRSSTSSSRRPWPSA